MCQAASCPLEIRVCGIQLVLRLLLATKFDQVLLLWVILRVWKAALPVRRIVLRRKMQRAVPARRIDDLQHARRNQKPTYRCLEHVFRCAFRWSSGMLDISKYAEHSLHVKACKDFLASLPRTTSANLKLEFAGVKVAAAPSALDLLLEKLGSAVASPSSSSRLWEPARCSDLRGEILRSTCWGLSRTQSCDIPSWDSGAAFGDWGSKGTTGAASVATGLSVLPAVDISATPTSSFWPEHLGIFASISKSLVHQPPNQRGHRPRVSAAAAADLVFCCARSSILSNAALCLVSKMA
eukprot:m.89039 g.89039  ORF g.89039 m.89039 type:complete len:295 (-) comp51027_c0_seq30:107-991(-)